MLFFFAYVRFWEEDGDGEGDGDEEGGEDRLHGTHKRNVFLRKQQKKN